MSPTAQLICAISAGTALLAGLVVTPIVRTLARRVGFVDKPDGGRKAHQHAVALGGGLAVAISTGCGFLAAAIASWAYGSQLPGLMADFRLPMFLSVLLILLLGLTDDAVAMRGRYKLLGQVMIGGFIIAAGLTIDRFSLFGASYELGWFAYPFTLFWLLGSINAINLIDGIDGLAGSVGVILCLTVASIFAFVVGRPTDVLILACLAGGLLGFLRYNFAPASIYLGDAGSMMVGLVIGVLAISGNAKSTLATGLMIPVAVWSIPILDSSAAILRRKLTGRSVFAADRGHLHHSLLSRGWSVRQASFFVALICAITCLSAVLSVVWKNEWIALFTVIAVVLYLISTKTFGHIEYTLVRDQITYNSLPATGGQRDSGGRERSISLQGSHEWKELWTSILEYAEGNDLNSVQLSINIPALNEVFFAKWSSTHRLAEEEAIWKLNFPFLAAGQSVGSIELSGAETGSKKSALPQLSESLDFLSLTEEEIDKIRKRITQERTGKLAERPNESDSNQGPEATIASPSVSS